MNREEKIAYILKAFAYLGETNKDKFIAFAKEALESQSPCRGSDRKAD